MKLFSLDLELNQPSRKIIQIGACVICQKTGKITDKLKLYINPNEPIDPRIEELTGIKQHQLDTEGYSVEEGYSILKNFVQKNKCFKNPIVWGSGAWNDSSWLYSQASTDDSNFMGHRVIDAKTLYQSLRLKSLKQVKGGLKTAMSELRLNFEGRNHDALDDAINTARIWFYLSRLIENGLKIQNQQGL